MAPEQLRAGAVDHGRIVFRVLLDLLRADEAAFPGHHAAGDRQPDPRSGTGRDRALQLRRDGSIKTIIRKALQKRPDFGYQNARDFYLDLLNARRRINTGDTSVRGQGASLSPIDFADAASALPMPPRRQWQAHGETTVAVLSFANITANQADDWVGQGIAFADGRPARTSSQSPSSRANRSSSCSAARSELGRRVDDHRRWSWTPARRSVVVSGAYQRSGRDPHHRAGPGGQRRPPNRNREDRRERV